MPCTLAADDPNRSSRCGVVELSFCEALAMSRFLLIVTSFLEFTTGIAMLIAPSQVIKLLLGNGLDSPQLLVLARITGAALISIGVSCWSTKDLDAAARAGLIRGLLIYNIAVPVVLIYAAINLGMRGLAFWLGCVVHSALAISCIVCSQGS
jgi:hypothetical protein